MITKAFSIYDSKALVFNPPFFALTVPAALRMFSDLANDKQSTVYKHPGDYVLYGIGEYDDSNGSLIAYKQHTHLGIASQHVSEQRELPTRLFNPDKLSVAVGDKGDVPFEINNGEVK